MTAAEKKVQLEQLVGNMIAKLAIDTGFAKPGDTLKVHITKEEAANVAVMVTFGKNGLNGKNGHEPNGNGHNEALDLKVEDVGFSTRVKNCLIGAGITDVRGIRDLSLKKLEKIDLFGKGCRREVVSRLGEMNINLEWPGV